jgi:hypothetical protein
MITRYPPNTIWLGGEIVQVNDVAAGEAIVPGMLVEKSVVSGKPVYKKHATAGASCVPAIVLDRNMLNEGVDALIPSGDLLEVGIFSPGATCWALIASGQNIAAGTKLESAGNGTLRAGSGQWLFAAVNSVDNTTGGTPRIVVEAL